MTQVFQIGDMMKRLFSFLKTTVFLLILCISLATTTISMAVWAFSVTSQVATMTASAATTAIAHRKSIAAAIAKTRARMTIQRKKAVAKAVVRTKSKARLRRIMVAVPLVGLAAAGYFEHGNYQEWKEDNPDGDLRDYSCEVSTLSAEVIDEVLQELPEKVRPSRKLVLFQLPECGDEKSGQSSDH